MKRSLIIHTTAGQHNSREHRDGLEHINVYSDGRTELGRLLSNFPRTPFYSERFGEFASLEGAWRWLSTGQQYDVLRSKFGVEARNFRRNEKVYYEGFQQDIIHVTHCKLRDNPRIYQMLMESHLPLAHYYYYGGTIVDASKSNMFQLLEYDAIRIKGLS